MSGQTTPQRACACSFCRRLDESTCSLPCGSYEYLVQSTRLLSFISFLSYLSLLSHLNRSPLLEPTSEEGRAKKTPPRRFTWGSWLRRRIVRRLIGKLGERAEQSFEGYSQYVHVLHLMYHKLLSILEVEDAAT